MSRVFHEFSMLKEKVLKVLEHVACMQATSIYGRFTTISNSFIELYSSIRGGVCVCVFGIS
jgi:acyl-CoA hydrolase